MIRSADFVLRLPEAVWAPADLTTIVGLPPDPGPAVLVPEGLPDR